MESVKVLLVEDDEGIRIQLARLIGRIYPEVLTASNGEEGFEIWQNHNPDVVVTDIMMPVLDGLEMVRKIRQVDQDTPVIVVSAFNDEDNLFKAINLGVDRFIPKPVDFSILKRELAKSVELQLARKRKEVLEEKMGVLTQAVVLSEDALAIYGVEEGFLFFNDAFYNLFGGELSQNLIEGDEKIFSIFPRVEEKIENANRDEGEYWEIEQEVEKDGREKKYYNIKGSPVRKRNGEFLGTLLFFHDITRSKNLELELINQRQKAIESDHYKTEFLSAMSHDIRTPINLIIGLADLVIENVQDDQQKKNLSLIKKSGESLLHLINDILDLSKIEAGKLQLEEYLFDLNEMLTYLADLFSGEAKKKGLRFDLDIAQGVSKVYKGDRYRLQQILINLIGNAFKFTASGHVVVAVRVLQQEGSEEILEFVVSDSGKGIAPDRIEKIFERFEQENLAISRSYGGTGLGTSIARSLTEMMGGEIRVESPAVRYKGDNKGGPGSEFVFTVKLLPATDQRSDYSGDNSQKEVEEKMEKFFQGKKFDILVAEDNEVNRVLLERVLTQFGQCADYAENGEVAVDMADQKKYDLVFMDIQMPVLGGVEAVNRLRARGYNGIIIACTSHSFRDDLEGFLAAGMDHYIIKPVNRSSVGSVLHYFMEKKDLV